jgi:hypothetical protein
MAHDVTYVNPQGELQLYEFDFAPLLPNDSTLANIGSGSTINAYNTAGTDVGATILSAKTRTNMKLSVEIGSVTEGEDYRIEFLGQGSTTSDKWIQVLEVRARRYVQGAA